MGQNFEEKEQAMSTKKEKKMIPVMVTTDKDKRGVFAGLVPEGSRLKSKMILKSARMAVYWDQSTRGVLGLASKGPGDGCRITPSVEELEIFGCESMTKISSKAWDKWEQEPWG
jgi:hypothetical protein